MLNQAFFKRILISEDGAVLGPTFTPVYDALAAWRPPTPWQDHHGRGSQKTAWTA